MRSWYEFKVFLEVMKTLNACESEGESISLERKHRRMVDKKARTGKHRTGLAHTDGHKWCASGRGFFNFAEASEGRTHAWPLNGANYKLSGRPWSFADQARDGVAGRCR